MIRLFKVLIILFHFFTTECFPLENKIILKINNDPITTLDVYEEINYLNFFNKNFNKINNKEKYEIAVQSILKEKIKKIELDKNFKSFELQDERYFNSLVETIYKKLNFRNINEFKSELKIRSIEYNQFKHKIINDIYWNQLIFIKYNNKLKINEEVLKKQIYNKKNYNKNYDLNEIVYEAKNVSEIDKIYIQIKEDINKLGFANAAIKHSISDSAVNGGKLGWVNEKTIDKKIINELNSIKLKSITKPIRISSGFLILQKNDEKNIKNNLNYEEELNKLINYEKEKQLNNFSNLYFNKIKKNIKINAP